MGRSANATTYADRSCRPRNGTGALLVLSATLTMVACGGSSSPSGQPTAQTRYTLTVAEPAVDPTSGTQVWASVVNGEFAKENLDVTINVVGTNVVTTVVSGQADLGAGAIGFALTPPRDGLETSIIYAIGGGGSGGFGFGSAKYASFKECKKVATFSTGSVAFGYATLYKSLYGANYTILQQDVPTEQAALASGTADCTVGSYGSFAGLVAPGKISLLVDPRNRSSLPSGFPKNNIEGIIWGVKSNLQKKSEAIRRFLKAMNRTMIANLRKSSPDELAALLRKSPDWQPLDAGKLSANLAVVLPFLAPNDGYISSADWPPTRQFYVDAGYSYINATDATWSYGRRFDMSYYEQAIGKPKKS